VRKQYKRNHKLFDTPDEELPVYGTIASQFNDPGTNRMRGAIEELDGDVDPAVRKVLEDKLHELELQLDGDARKALEEWPAKAEQYRAEEFVFKVRDKEIRVTNYHESLSHTKLPKIALPKYRDEGDLLKWLMRENVPGEFPFTAGVFPFKRVGEDPTRMFAGEGGPERTNRRFHYVSEGMPAKRLSTAFDSVTLYGEDPDERPDIYGKIGNAGVAICTLDDAKKLYSGFDLCDPKTSVSMTINGPAPMLLGFFLNSAIDQQCELYIKEHGLEADVEAALERKFDDQGLPRPSYQGQMPPSNNGLGLMLLGLSGDEVLPPNVYAPIKERDAAVGARHGAGRHPQGGPGAEHLHLLDRVRPQDDGRHPAVLRRSEGAQLLLGVDQRLPHRRGRSEPDHAARLHARERLHVRRVLPLARHAHRHVRAEPVVLLQQRPRPRVLGDRARRPAYLGQGDQEQVRRQRAQPEAQVPHPDFRAFAARAGDRVQRHPDDAAGALRDLRQLQLACTPTPTTRRSPRPPRNPCVGRWPSS
jgi:hypothetical protein